MQQPPVPTEDHPLIPSPQQHNSVVSQDPAELSLSDHDSTPTLSPPPTETSSTSLSRSAPPSTPTPSLIDDVCDLEDDDAVVSYDSYGFALNKRETLQNQKFAPLFEARESKLEKRWEPLRKRYKWDVNGFPNSKMILQFSRFDKHCRRKSYTLHAIQIFSI